MCRSHVFALWRRCRVGDDDDDFFFCASDVVGENSENSCGRKQSRCAGSWVDTRAFHADPTPQTACSVIGTAPRVFVRMTPNRATTLDTAARFLCPPTSLGVLSLFSVAKRSHPQRTLVSRASPPFPPSARPGAPCTRQGRHGRGWLRPSSTSASSRSVSAAAARSRTC